MYLYHTMFQDVTCSVAPLSQVRTTVMLVILIVGN